MKFLIGAILIGLCACSESTPPTPVATESETPTQAPQQFDLLCKGKEIINDKYGADNEITYRIDLAASNFCQEDCKRLWPIAEVEAGKLTLQKYGNDGTGRAVEINRITGEYHEEVNFGGVHSHENGHCGIRPFTGLSKPKF